MKMRLIPAIALMAALMSGGALSAYALPVDAANEPNMEGGPNPDYAAAMEHYNRLLADYRKDLAAYEADPGTWTADIPRMPVKPDIAETGTRLKEPTQQVEQ